MYKRIISYVYSYDNGEKINNCGYFRFDTREKQCKLSINVKVPEKYTMPVAEIYVLKQEDDRLKAVLLGKTSGLNGVICYKHMCLTDDIVENISIDKMLGILIYNGENLKRSFAGNLKDETIEVLSIKKAFEEENTVYEIDEECQSQWCAQIEDEDIETEEDMEDIPQLMIGVEQGVKSEEIKESPVLWQELLFTKFPKVRVNFDKEDCEAIKMRPHDLVWFPRKYWRFSNNQCLLRGYYNHRYIMLVKGCGNREGSYYLSVPGNYCIMEEKAAKRQGFNEFVANKGDFGFWCCKVGQ